MSKKQVPASLHSEFSGYASLLRVLRTNNTLDVASQLTKSPTVGPDVDDDDLYEPDPSDSEHSRPPTPATGKGKKGKEKEKASSDILPKRRLRDNWTRWPLPPAEVQPTEWGFQEEIRSLAQQALGLHYESPETSPQNFLVPLPTDDTSAQPHGRATVDCIPDLDALSRPALRLITEASSIHLERMLSSLVSFAPVADHSSQSRFDGIGWEMVLQAVSAAGLMDVTSVARSSSISSIFNIFMDRIIESVQRRLERLYGPSEIPRERDTL
jgi:hypothetical protein